MPMTTSRKLFAIFILILSSQVCASAQSPTNACGGQPLCMETSDFTTTVTSFRTSTGGTSRIINVSVRFQNRTAQPLVLGYVANSGITTDEHGNRYIVYGGNAYRGIGLVYGNTFDPRLTLRPAGSGDAQFEMHLPATSQNVGQTFTVDLTIDEINTTGNQPALGGEFPLHFEGLTNGVSQGVGSIAGAPDGLANAVSNLKSIFGKKKAVQNAATVASSAASTAATVNTAANSAASQSSSATANTPGQAGSSSIAPQPSTSSQTGATNSAPAPQTPAQPQLRQGSAKAAPQQVASAQPAVGTPNGQAAGAAEPWTPPADKAAEAAALVDPLKLPEVAKMPDVVGVRLGMTEQQALQILHGQYPRDQFQEIPTSGNIPEYPKADYGFNVLPTGEIATDVVVSLTAPPSRQVVWHIVRFTRRLHANHANVLATLREKYGKESFAGLGNGTITTDDRNIGMLFWIYDEHGSRAPMPAAQAFGSNDITFCLGRGINLNPGPRIPMDEVKDPNWCASFVGVVAQIDPFEIVENTLVAVMDMRLANRTANGYVAWKRDADAKARAAEIAKSKKNKPVF
jgi:hypothetical protein